jgi:photosynthetic reaction center H subunit
VNFLWKLRSGQPVDLAVLGLLRLLIYYLQTENMREGYPLETEDGKPAPNQGPFPVPEAQDLPAAARARRRVSCLQRKTRPRIAARSCPGPHRRVRGFPHAPTGNPMLDGVGPASWAPRRDEPELDGHGHNKIVPMAGRRLCVSPGATRAGLPVQASDLKFVGHHVGPVGRCPEQLVRYLEVTLTRAPSGWCRCPWPRSGPTACG